MKIGILGMGAVGRFLGVDVLPRVNGYRHKIYAYDPDPERMKSLPASAFRCGCEEEVAYNSDILIGCMPMLEGDALTRAVYKLKRGAVASGDFSAKTPEYAAVAASGRLQEGDVSYYSMHTLSAPNPKIGLKGQLIAEIPVLGCGEEGDWHPYVSEFRETLKAAGSTLKTLKTVEEHDMIMGRIQGATSAENICTALTLARLGVNPLHDESGTYGSQLDRANFLMALRAIGEKGSSNSTVYGSIVMLNPFALANIDGYIGVLDELADVAARDDGNAEEMLREARERLGPETVAEAARLWDKGFGPDGETKNSYSSHLAEAIWWSRSPEKPETLRDFSSPPYRMRSMMAFKALSMGERCVDNMRSGRTDDIAFLETTRELRKWAGYAANQRNRKVLDEFEGAFFEPVREAFPDEIKDIANKTNALIAVVKST